MAVLKPRERIVYFRLSEDEFQCFENACKQAGARSLSDLARSAIKRLISDMGEQNHQHEVVVAVRSLEELMTDLQSKVQFLIDVHQAKRPAQSELNSQAPVLTAGRSQL